MAQLKVTIPDTQLGVRRGAAMPLAGTVNVGSVLPGPPQLQRADPDLAAAGWQGLKKGADAVQAWADASIKTADATAAARAKIGAINALADAQAAVSADQTITDAGKLSEAWTTRTTEIGAKLSEGLSRGARQVFDLEFAELSAARLINVRSDFAQRQGQASLATLKELSLSASNAAVAARNTAERDTIVNSFEAAVQAQLASGAINPTQAGQLRMGFRGDIDEARVRRAIAADPTAAIAMINDTRQTPNIPADRRAALLNSAVTAQQGRAAQGVANEMRTLSLESARARAEERVQQTTADEAEKAFIDAQRAGRTAEAAAALDTLRRVGRPGAYASASDSFYGRAEAPTSPQMRTWLADRLDGRGGAPLTRAELENARAGRSINDTVYREGIEALRSRESVNYRQAEEFVDNALGAPSPTIADRDLQPWQRQARTQRGAILNDLRLELRRNPDTDPLRFVQDRLREAGDPARAVERARNREALGTIPEAARTPEGIAELRARLSQYEAYRRLGWWDRQTTATVPPPMVDTGAGRQLPLTADVLNRWSRIVEGAQ